MWFHHFMANRWGNNGKSERLYFGGSKITADGDCSHEIKRRLPLGRKVTTNVNSILKSRDITLPTKICLVKAMVFPVVTCGCDRWTIKKAEHQRSDAFELLEKTLESPLDSKEIQPIHPKENKSWIIIGRTDAEAETPILWPPDAKNWLIGGRPLCRERLRAGGEGNDRGWDGWMASLTQWTWVWGNSRSWWWTGRPSVLQSVGSQRIGHNWLIELTSWIYHPPPEWGALVPVERLKDVLFYISPLRRN